jgi:glyoxylase-like metal-dependent hydrolase (beta-lactamase superfamily II)
MVGYGLELGSTISDVSRSWASQSLHGGELMNNFSISNLSRRNFIAVAGSAAAAVAFAPRFLFAESKGIVATMIDEAASTPITTYPLRRNISVLEGSGGNIAVLTGKNGKLLVDSGFTVSKPRIVEALNRLSSEPIAQLLNTHWHTDHTDGNAWVHDAGAKITAHVNTRKHLSTSTRVEGWSWTFPSAPSGAIPSVVFDDEHRLQHNDTNIRLKYYGPAHTDSDVSVLFEEADVMHVGDTWWNGIYPFIDRSTGGSIDGMIRATERNLRAIADTTIVIPGHGPVGKKAGLKNFRDMLVTIRNNVAMLKNQGKSLSEAVAAKPTAAYDAQYGQFLITPAFFTTLVYAGV